MKTPPSPTDSSSSNESPSPPSQPGRSSPPSPSIFNLSAHYDSLCNMIIRPPRCYYTVEDMGPKSFRIGAMTFVRNDFELINARGHPLQCSHFKRSEYWENNEKQPCVIYCHGNSGCRLDGLDCVRSLLPMNITVLIFDFSGSGLSGGQYVSLGYYEKEDIKVIVNHLRSTEKISTIGLWGRSMGAVTSLLYAREDPSIAGMVLDSPFSSLYKVSEELVHSAVQKIPKLMISLGLKMIRSSIKKKANFDIKELDILPVSHEVFIPAVFAHGEEDNFVRPHHSEKLFEKYSGDKNRILLAGGHNSERPAFFFESVCIFFVNTLKPNLDQPIMDFNLNKTAIIDTFSNLEHDSIEQKLIEEAILLSLKENEQRSKDNNNHVEPLPPPVNPHQQNSTTTTTTTTTTTSNNNNNNNNTNNTSNTTDSIIIEKDHHDENCIKS
ncbi:hypothetical protein CYY_004339 [Polysphondylium violaceum]|uniref:Serine aminopeptidase S33 domain-containing protein n=1 Tax=Polysphondylium violaceum TaxID=133409 RepID=A0A8J4PUS4_9MYCE|nr:hypothetical protein CYY_004339 [Polysphondylium violaceum]